MLLEKSLYKFIFREENFMVLNQLDVTYLNKKYLSKKYGVENWFKFIRCHNEWVDSKKESLAPLPQSTFEFAKQPESYKNSPELPANDYEQNSIPEKEEQKFALSTPRQIKKSCQMLTL